jgi:hypothetical protein
MGRRWALCGGGLARFGASGASATIALERSDHGAGRSAYEQALGLQARMPWPGAPVNRLRLRLNRRWAGESARRAND